MPAPRIADTTPVACAGCHGQYPERTHIDFATAFEGPIINAAEPRTQRIDWLVLCERCVARANALLPQSASRADELAALQRRLDEESDRADRAEDYASNLEDTLQRRPEPAERAVRRARPKPASGKPNPRAPRYVKDEAA